MGIKGREGGDKEDKGSEGGDREDKGTGVVNANSGGQEKQSRKQGKTRRR